MASVSNITNKVIRELGTSEQVMITTTSVQKGACVGLSVTNLKPSVVKVSVILEDSSEVRGYYVKDLLIAPNSSARIINGGEKLLLAPNNVVSIVSDTNASLDVIFSLVVITYS
jgi:hypothetical protein